MFVCEGLNLKRTYWQSQGHEQDSYVTIVFQLAMVSPILKVICFQLS